MSEKEKKKEKRKRSTQPFFVKEFGSLRLNVIK
jgi:hypothetical protein